MEFDQNVQKLKSKKIQWTATSVSDPSYFSSDATLSKLSDTFHYCPLLTACVKQSKDTLKRQQTFTWRDL